MTLISRSTHLDEKLKHECVNEKLRKYSCSTPREEYNDNLFYCFIKNEKMFIKSPSSIVNYPSQYWLTYIYLIAFLLINFHDICILIFQYVPIF
jgi:hypothetical protein